MPDTSTVRVFKPPALPEPADFLPVCKQLSMIQQILSQVHLDSSQQLYKIQMIPNQVHPAWSQALLRIQLILNQVHHSKVQPIPNHICSKKSTRWILVYQNWCHKIKMCVLVFCSFCPGFYCQLQIDQAALRN